MKREYQKGLPVVLGPHFESTEFDCHCHRTDCTRTYIDDKLIEALNRKREVWGKPVTIISGFRCTAHNIAVKGAAGSYHLIGMAADICVEGMAPHVVADCCEDMGGLGRAEGFTHIDVRYKRARWKY